MNVKKHNYKHQYTYSREGNPRKMDYSGWPIYEWYVEHVTKLAQQRSQKNNDNKQPALSKQKQRG
jgi:hypothetical protein